MPSFATVGAIASVYGVNQYVIDMKRIASETSRTNIAVQSAVRGMNNNVISGLGRGMTNLGNQIRNIGNSISQLGFTWSATFGLASVTAIAGSIRAGLEFEKTLQRIQHLTDLSAEEVEAWGQRLLRLGPALGKMPNELAEGLYFITSVGVKDANKAFDILEQSAKASALGMGEMDQIAKSLVSILEVYGDTGLTAQEVTNGLYIAIKDAAFEADGLTKSFARLLPYAKAANLDFAEATGYLAAFSRLGASPEMATTSLINALNFVIDPTMEARKELEKYGLTIENVRESIDGPNGFSGTMLQLVDIMGSDIARLFTNRATAGVLGVASVEQYRSIVEEISKAVNLQEGEISALEQAFETYTGSVNFAFQATRSALSSVGIQLFESIKAPLTDVLQLMTKYLMVLQEILFNNPELAALGFRILLIAAALGPLIILIGTLVRSFGNILALVSTPIRVLGLGFGVVELAATAAFKAIYNGQRVAFAALNTSVKNTITTFSALHSIFRSTESKMVALGGAIASMNRQSNILSRKPMSGPFARLGQSIVLANYAFVRLLTTISRGGFALAEFSSTFRFANLQKRILDFRNTFVKSTGDMRNAVRNSKIVAAWQAAFARIRLSAYLFSGQIRYMSGEIATNTRKAARAFSELWYRALTKVILMANGLQFGFAQATGGVVNVVKKDIGQEMITFFRITYARIIAGTLNFAGRMDRIWRSISFTMQYWAFIISNRARIIGSAISSGIASQIAKMQAAFSILSGRINTQATRLYTRLHAHIIATVSSFGMGLRFMLAQLAGTIVSMFWPAAAAVRSFSAFMAASLTRIGAMLTAMAAAVATRFRLMIAPMLPVLRMFQAAVLVAVHKTVAALTGVLIPTLTMTMATIARSMAALVASAMSLIFTTITSVASALFTTIAALLPVVISAAGTAVGVIASVGGSILALVSPILAVGAAVAAGILLLSGLAKKLSEIFGRVRATARKETPSLAGDMRSYGKNIIEQFSKGMIDGLIAVVQALRYIASVVRSWLRPGSPPKILPDLTIWGAGAMAAYMEGWTDIDFSAFKEISDKFKTFFSSLMSPEGTTEEQLGVLQNLVGFRDLLASAIGQIDAVGTVSDTIWASINAGLQGASLEMQNYVRLTLMAAEAQERVRDIQEQIAAVTATYDTLLDPLKKQLEAIKGEQQQLQNEDRIKELNKIINNKRASANARRQAALEIEAINLEAQIGGIEKERDLQLEALNAQLEAAQKQYDLLAAQAQHAESLLDLQIEQNELLREQARLLEELIAKGEEGGAEEEETGGEGFGEGTPFDELGPPGEMYDELTSGLEGLVPTGILDTKMAELKAELGGLASDVAGITGIIWEKFQELWNGRLKPLWEDIVEHPFVQEVWDIIKDTVQGVQERFEQMRPVVDSIKDGFTTIQPVIAGLGLVVLSIARGFSQLIINLAGIFGTIMTRLIQLAPFVRRIGEAIAGVIGAIVTIFSGGEGGWAALGAALWEFLSSIGAFLAQILSSIVDIGLRIVASIIDAIFAIVERLLLGFEQMTGISTEKLREWLANAREKLYEFITSAQNWGSELWLIIVDVWEQIKAGVGEKVAAIRTAVEEAFTAVSNFINEKIEAIRGFFQRWDDRTQETRDKISEFSKMVKTTIATLAARLLVKFIEITGGMEKWEKRIAELKKAWETFKDKVAEYIEFVKDRVSDEIDIIRTQLRNFSTSVQNAWNKVKAFSDAIDGIMTGIKNAVVGAIEEAIRILNEWLDALISVWNWLNEHVFRIQTETSGTGETPSTGTGRESTGRSSPPPSTSYDIADAKSMDMGVVSTTSLADTISDTIDEALKKIQESLMMSMLSVEMATEVVAEFVRKNDRKYERLLLIEMMSLEYLEMIAKSSKSTDRLLSDKMNRVVIMQNEQSSRLSNMSAVFGDTYINNSVDAAAFEARVRNIVIRMMAS